MKTWQGRVSNQAVRPNDEDGMVGTVAKSVRPNCKHGIIGTVTNLSGQMISMPWWGQEPTCRCIKRPQRWPRWATDLINKRV